MAPHDFSVLTQSSFENGIPASRWCSLCQLLRAKEPLEERAQSVDGVISNAIFTLFSSYPADPTLLEYIGHAMQEGLISLPVLLATFLQASKSPGLQNPTTMESLCRMIISQHYLSSKPALGSLIPLGESASLALERVLDSFSLLSVACSIPPPHFQGVSNAASELCSLLLSCVEVNKVNLNDSMLLCTQIHAIANLPLPALLLDQLSRLEMALNLNIMDKSDRKAAREGPLIHDLTTSIGPGIVAESLPETDLSTCSVASQHLVRNMGSRFGPGNAAYAIATLCGLYRWTSWPLAIFYRQLLLSNFNYLAQLTASSASQAHAVRLWWLFLIGRLPTLLYKITSGDVADLDWRRAFQEGLVMAFNHHDVLSVCNQPTEFTQGQTFTAVFLSRLLALGCIEADLATNLDPTAPPPEVSRCTRDAASAGLSVSAYIEGKLSTSEGNYEELEEFFAKVIAGDYSAHAAFAEAIVKRLYTLFNAIQPENEGATPVFGGNEADRAGSLLRLLYEQDVALEILAIHADLEPLLSVLAVWENCDLDSDPQTSVNHLGYVVLFMYSTVARFKLTVSVSGRIQSTPGVYLDAAHITRSPDKMSEEDRTAYATWKAALFAANSNEGIGDASFSAARPISFLRIAPTLVYHAIMEVGRGTISMDILREGLSYFCGPLFNWTLTDVIKVILADFQRTGFQSPRHFEVLETFIMSKTTPKPVLQLCSPVILRTLNDAVTQRIHVQSKGHFDVVPWRKRVLHAIGLARLIEGSHGPPNFDDAKAHFPKTDKATVELSPPGAWQDLPAQHLRDALSAVQAGRAPVLDVPRCLPAAPPAAFVHTLFDVLLHAAGVGTPVAHCRALATLALVLPCRVGTRALPGGAHPQARTLLPVFLYAVLPRLLALLDAPPPLAADPTTRAELLVAVVASSLTAALQLERAYGGMANTTPAPEENAVPAPAHTAGAMARRLAEYLRLAAAKSHSATLLLQRLAAMSAFTANFPVFVK